MKSDRVKYVEDSLNVKLPDDYSKFLTEYGDYEINGSEIYGYTEAYIDVEQIPCVIGATKIYRNDYNLSSSEIVISYSGFEDLIVVLDTKTGKVHEIDLDGNKQLLANSFQKWFSQINNY